MTASVLEGQTLFRFDNGLRLLVDPVPGLRTFALNALVHGGTRFESETQSGWAHLMEHMVFKGAGSRDARALAEVIEREGGSINASTGYEHTRFEVRGLTRLLPLALEVVSDLMFRPVLDGAELEREKKVIEQEILEAYDTPDDHVFDLLQAVMFPDQAIGRPILGSKASLRPARPDPLRAFARTLYAPHRVVICVSGGVDAEAVYQAARKHIEAVATQEGFATPQAMRFFAGHAVQHRRIEQANLALAFDGIGRRDPDIIPLRLFSEILGGGMASRLFQEARETRGLAYTVDSWATPYRDGGVFGVFAGCAPRDVAALQALILEVTGQLARDPSEAELTRAKAQFQTSLFLNHENAAARASTFASHISVFERVLGLDEVAADIDRATREDLVRIGERLTGDSPFSSALLGPKSMTGAARA